jgi:hypothetical protein
MKNDEPRIAPDYRPTILNAAALHFPPETEHRITFAVTPGQECAGFNLRCRACGALFRDYLDSAVYGRCPINDRGDCEVCDGGNTACAP